MKKAPKYALGLAITAIVFFLVLTKLFPTTIRNFSTFQIDSAQNQFYISFNLNKADKPQFEKVLSALQLPSNVAKRVSFELDGTPSATLAFVTPITGQLDISKNELNFSGNIQRPVVSQNLPFQTFNFPKNLNFAISATNLTRTAQKYLELPQDLADTIAKESAHQNQVIATFGTKPNVVYIFKTGNFDVTDLKELVGESGYKEETSGRVNLYILKSITVFEIGQYTFITSNLDSAKTMINALKSNNPTKFPQENEGVLSLIFINPAKNPAPQDLLVKVFGSSVKTPKFLNNVSQLDFTLKDKSFTGSIKTR